MNKATKIIVEVILLAAIAALAYLLYSNIMQPVHFNKEKNNRQAVAVQRLKDIRTLQVAYKSVTGKFNSSLDSLKQFYESGEMAVVMQVGSMDDSLAVAHTEAVKKANRGKITNEQLYDMYLKGDKNLVFSVENKIPVRDTLFNDRPDFNIDSLKYIPFSGKQPIQMEATTRMVSGVPVPLFEARIPWRSLLKGMNNQLRINLDAESRDLNRYEGLQVGSVTTPNNNAGNWE